MAFDQSTRNRLQKLVSDCRKLLSEEFSIQLQQTYGIDPNSGEVAGLDRLTHLSDRDRQTAELLRDTLAHYLAVDADDKAHRIAAIDRIIREQAFTVLNRLAALLMMEARGLLAAAVVSQGQQSQAFELYKMVSGSSLGKPARLTVPSCSACLMSSPSTCRHCSTAMPLRGVCSRASLPYLKC